MSKYKISYDNISTTTKTDNKSEQDIEINDDKFKEIISDSKFWIWYKTIWTSNKYSKDKNKKYTNSSLTYGELTNDGVKSMFNDIDTTNKVFYDLGSGEGSVIINAISNFPQLKKAIGVEYLKERNDVALERSKSLENRDKMEFIEGDFTDDKIDLSDADLIYISNLCLSDETNKEIADKINREVKKGAIVFSISKMPLKNVKNCFMRKVNQTWRKGSNIYVNKLL